jgi:hypothetical protein
VILHMYVDCSCSLKHIVECDFSVTNRQLRRPLAYYLIPTIFGLQYTTLG